MDTRTHVKITYQVMYQYPEGTMSPESLFVDRDDNPLPPYDMGAIGASPFSTGHLTAEYASEHLPSAVAWANARTRTRDGIEADVWIDKVTETTTRERVAYSGKRRPEV